MSDVPKNYGFSTQAIRTQMTKTPVHEHSTPLYLTSSYAFDDAAEAEAKFANLIEGPIYSRYSNPNTDELSAKIKKLEGAEAALPCASGMAAIFSAIAGILGKGDHIVASLAIFGSTYTLLTQILPRFGIETSFVAPSDHEAWEKAIQKNTRMLFAETPTNPGLDLVDLEFLGNLARTKNIILTIDNCFATPYLQKPIQFGTHIVCHSTTKFMDGQGRTLGGLIAGKADLLEQIQFFTRASGPALSPFNAWIISKSLETLAVRMDRHCSNALALAQILSEQKGLTSVRYPFLPSHPQVDLAKKQMKMGGGLLSFDLGSKERAHSFIDKLGFISRSANLGDTRSIVTHPATTTHAKVPEDLRNKLGVTPGLVRMSVGLEDLEDLKTDLLVALGSLS